MASPSNIVPIPLPHVNQALSTEIVDLLPANSSASTQYSPSNSNRILFNLPSFQNSFLDGRKTSLRFKITTSMNASGGTALTAGMKAAGTLNGALLGDGIPVFNRLVVKSGTGLTLEDISGLHIVNKLIRSTTNASLLDGQGAVSGFYEKDREDKVLSPAAAGGAATNLESEAADVLNGSIMNAQLAGREYTQNLTSGIFGSGQEFLIPLTVLSGHGSAAASIELYLTPVAEAMILYASPGTTANTINHNYVISDVRLNLTLVQVSEEIAQKFTKSVMGSSDLVIPFTSFRQHLFNKNDNATTADYDLLESESALNRVFVVHRKQNSASVSAIDPLRFRGGFQDTVTALGGHANNPITSYQFRYGSQYKPNAKHTSSTDSTDIMLNVMNATTGLQGNPFLATCKPGKCYPRFEDDQFMLCADFTISRDRFLQGANPASSGMPIHCHVDFLGAAPNLQCEMFTMSQKSLIIEKNGMMQLTALPAK